MDIYLFYNLYLKYSKKLLPNAYFESNKLLHSSQYGFEEGHWTEFAAL